MGLYKAKPRLVDLYTLDNTVLSTLSIPDDLDAGVCRAMILQECGELETVFETSAELKAYLIPWSTAHAEPWERMLSALSAEYNPIHNYDRTDTETIEDTEEGSSESTGTATVNDETSETGTETVDGEAGEYRSVTESETVTGNATTDEDISETGSATTSVTKADTTTIAKMGFDSSTFVNSDQTAVSATESGTSATTKTTARDVQTNTESETDKTTSETVDSTEDREVTTTRSSSGSSSESDHRAIETTRDAERTRELHSSGNIGVTTAQQMITAELEMRAKYELYSIIVRAFSNDICVGVW